MIKAIILDFGGVIFIDKPKKDWIGPQETLDCDPELWAKGVVGQVDDEYIFKTIAQVYGVDLETVNEWLLSRREPNQELLNLLSKVKPGVKKAILNNGLKALFRGYLEKYGVGDQFEALVNSAEEGIKKPNAEIFLRTCQKLDVEPGDCVFVDNDERYVEGAKKVGMKAILFTSTDNLKTEFENLGLI